MLKEKGLLTKDTLAASVNGKTVDLAREVCDNAEIAPLTFDDEER